VQITAAPIKTTEAWIANTMAPAFLAYYPAMDIKNACNKYRHFFHFIAPAEELVPT
jgi:hypothetical protein